MAGVFDAFLPSRRTPKTPPPDDPGVWAQEPVDYDALESALRALSYSSRLELLRLLRQPAALQDLQLAPRQVRSGENPDRTISRQSLKAHLDKLIEVGLVQVQDPHAPGKRAKEYTVNPQRFYQLLEEFRKIGLQTTGGPVTRDETVDLSQLRPPAMEPGPKLLLVHGLAEGRIYPLETKDLVDGRGWILGRKEGIPISLSYDPYVSLENAEILKTEDRGYDLLDLRTSKNGTWLNWNRLERGEKKRLTPGDVIGVGRSSLVFREH